MKPTPTEVAYGFLDIFNRLRAGKIGTDLQCVPCYHKKDHNKLATVQWYRGKEFRVEVLSEPAGRTSLTSTLKKLKVSKAALKSHVVVWGGFGYRYRGKLESIVEDDLSGGYIFVPFGDFKRLERVLSSLLKKA